MHTVRLTMAKHAAYGLSIRQLDVVLIDDNDSMIQILRAIFSAFKVDNLRSFTDAEKALQSAIEAPPHLVVTDWRMRPLDGLSLLRTIRHSRMDPLCFAAAMVVSGHASEDHVSSAFLAGANQFLVKPVSPASLLERIRWICRDSRELVLEDQHYVIEGMRESVEKRRRARGYAVLTEDQLNRRVFVNG